MIVVGHSMAPALQNRQRVWLWRTRPGYAYEVGQVVAFEHTRGHGRPPLLVKRIVEVADPGSTLPPGHVRVLGDGRMSLDSRQLGPIPEASIRGVVVSRWS